jgi:hypothetical protein
VGLTSLQKLFGALFETSSFKIEAACTAAQILQIPERSRAGKHCYTETDSIILRPFTLSTECSCQCHNIWKLEVDDGPAGAATTTTTSQGHFLSKAFTDWQQNVSCFEKMSASTKSTTKDDEDVVNKNKRQRTTSDDDDDDDDDKVVVTKVVQTAAHVASASSMTTTQQQQVRKGGDGSSHRRLKSVYIAFACDYPVQNDKWGEHSGHETQDTEVLGVYATLQDANRAAKYEAFEHDDDDDDEDEDEEEEEGESLFYWQDEMPDGWKARRVWVEEQNIQY